MTEHLDTLREMFATVLKENNQNATVRVKLLCVDDKPEEVDLTDDSEMGRRWNDYARHHIPTGTETYVAYVNWPDQDHFEEFHIDREPGQDFAPLPPFAEWFGPYWSPA
jgi:hypothetical protein